MRGFHGDGGVLRMKPRSRRTPFSLCDAATCREVQPPTVKMRTPRQNGGLCLRRPPERRFHYAWFVDHASSDVAPVCSLAAQWSSSGPVCAGCHPPLRCLPRHADTVGKDSPNFGVRLRGGFITRGSLTMLRVTLPRSARWQPSGRRPVLCAPGATHLCGACHVTRTLLVKTHPNLASAGWVVFDNSSFVSLLQPSLGFGSICCELEYGCQPRQ